MGTSTIPAMNPPTCAHQTTSPPVQPIDPSPLGVCRRNHRPCMNRDVTSVGALVTSPPGAVSAAGVAPYVPTKRSRAASDPSPYDMYRKTAVHVRIRRIVMTGRDDEGL